MQKFIFMSLAAVIFSMTLNIQAEAKTEQQRSEINALRHEQMQLKIKERLLRLKLALKLKDNQMKAWSKYKNRVLTSSSQRTDIARELKAKYRTSGQLPNSLELAQTNIQRLEQKLSSAKANLSALTDFYQVLNNKQRLKIDKLTLRKIKKEANKLRQYKETESRKYQRDN